MGLAYSFWSVLRFNQGDEMNQSTYSIEAAVTEHRQALAEWNVAIVAFESFGIAAPRSYYRQREQVTLTLMRLCKLRRTEDESRNDLLDSTRAVLEARAA